MMKQHRASWARTIGGVLSVALVGAAALAFASPSFAEEQPAAQVVVNKGGADPIIEKRDIETLRAKCGGEKDRDAIVCDDDEAKDPEVRAIMARTRKRVDERVGEAMARAQESLKAVRLDREQHRAAARRAKEAQARAEKQVARFSSIDGETPAKEALERAREQLAQLDEARHEANVARAVALAHSQEAHQRAVAAVNVDAIRRSALASARAARASARVASRDHYGPSAEEMAELKAEMAELRRELKVEMEREMRELREELERELGEQQEH